MINLKNLDFHLENLCESNRCFNDEEKLGLLYGMTNLEDKINKEIYLWGKIEGIQNDYYITYYFNQEKFFPQKKFYYCNNDYEFHEVIKGNDILIEKIEKKKPFTLFNGLPNSFYSKSCKSKTGKRKNYIHDENEKNEDDDSEMEESEKYSSDNQQSEDEKVESENSGSGNSSRENSESEKSKSEKHESDSSENKPSEYGKIQYEKKKNKRDKKKNHDKLTDITEVERLSYVIRKIDEDAFIVPHNSVKITNNLEMKFSNFTGLNILDALKLTSWVHFRYPKNLTYDKIKNYNTFFLDNFLDSINSDIPTNIWNIKINKELSKISIINCLYPGYVFYHMLNTPFYASIYIGNGISNYDLPFLLP
ncbi:radial spoke head protein 9 [Plasmodium brasilianum]|uniref:Radial spoke head protein 9 homolog n=2 Tax=Plasmodium (Plasmodium) TaxID=418103 RepID=A0A1A8WF85_PLAMA|nr:conserved Plasmodium protein, unknown function [Plasmodium malariae]KAI4834881.1 radial spoke head protein 9 [Plasmodium brasilianum]SBS90718.1 conserved Plasmodium protein, unknown function [Plasmodium malariae]SCP03448.1 conserved Plasmodium protein, unknown function [Plasmodium malariae]